MRLSGKILSAHVRHPDLQRPQAPLPHPPSVLADPLPNCHAAMLHVTHDLDGWIIRSAGRQTDIHATAPPPDGSPELPEGGRQQASWSCSDFDALLATGWNTAGSNMAGTCKVRRVIRVTTTTAPTPYPSRSAHAILRRSRRGVVALALRRGSASRVRSDRAQAPPLKE